MDVKLFASSFALIAVAELPGKTTFTSMLLSARSRPAPVFLGACAAFVLHTALAVAAGRLIGLLPARAVQAATGFIFLALGAALWRHASEEESGAGDGRGGDFKKILAAAFAVTFSAQWGDLTQVATAALAAKYDAPWTIFLAATSALWTVTALAVAAGQLARRRLHPAKLRKASAAIIACVGLALLLRSLR